jgi:hypothetical protein
MNAISLQDAYYYLSQCPGILLEGTYIEPMLFEIEEDFENEWLVLEWDDLYNQEETTISVSFLEKDNQTVFVEGSTMLLTSIHGDQEKITLLRKWEPLKSNNE